MMAYLFVFLCLVSYPRIYPRSIIKQRWSCIFCHHVSSRSQHDTPKPNDVTVTGWKDSILSYSKKWLSTSEATDEFGFPEVSRYLALSSHLDMNKLKPTLKDPSECLKTTKTRGIIFFRNVLKFWSQNQQVSNNFERIIQLIYQRNYGGSM